MPETDHIKLTLTHYRNRYQQLIDEIKPRLDEMASIEALVRRLAADAGEPANIPSFNALPGLGGVESLPASTSSARSNLGNQRAHIRPDEFFGMTQTEAARAYLKMTGGRAISLDELVNALQAGGAKVGGADPRRTLYVSLKVNPKKEFVWPTKDHVGLAEAYQKQK